MSHSSIQFDCDVAIVGYGPTSQCLAALLGQAGYSVEVFERWPTLYPLPRACVVDHEVMRILQVLGVATDFSLLAVPTDGEYLWLNAQGETLYHFKYDREGVSGWPARNLIYQPELEAVLDSKVRSLPSVSLHQGWEAVALDNSTDVATLTLQATVERSDVDLTANRDTRTCRARYVIGADGANSFVRHAAGLSMTDLGFRADWLVVDFRPNEPERALEMPQAAQICDPARPMTLMRHMGRNHVRWEMMLLPGETAQEMTQPSMVWPMIAKWVTPDDGVIDRAAVYTFRSGVAPEWVRGRTLLAGDAAHLMPPFLGQGLCSGLRDALAVFWRLDWVLRGLARPALLQCYEDERKQHVSTVIERAVALGKVVCITDPEEAAKRDAAILDGTAPAIPGFPGLDRGLLHRDPSGCVKSPVGQLALQARVGADGRVGLLDDFTGLGWSVLSAGPSLLPQLSPELRNFTAKIGMHFINFDHKVHGQGFVDVDGRYTSYLKGLNAQAIIVRPDFYVFAVATSLSELPMLLEELQNKLSFAPPGNPSNTHFAEPSQENS